MLSFGICHAPLLFSQGSPYRRNIISNSKISLYIKGRPLLNKDKLIYSKVTIDSVIEYFVMLLRKVLIITLVPKSIMFTYTTEYWPNDVSLFE